MHSFTTLFDQSDEPVIFKKKTSVFIIIIFNLCIFLPAHTKTHIHIRSYFRPAVKKRQKKNQSHIFKHTQHNIYM